MPSRPAAIGFKKRMREISSVATTPSPMERSVVFSHVAFSLNFFSIRCLYRLISMGSNINNRNIQDFFEATHCLNTIYETANKNYIHKYQIRLNLPRHLDGFFSVNCDANGRVTKSLQNGLNIPRNNVLILNDEDP